jgi:phosphatidylglycerophosphatase A
LIRPLASEFQQRRSEFCLIFACVAIDAPEPWGLGWSRSQRIPPLSHPSSAVPGTVGIEVPESAQESPRRTLALAIATGAGSGLLPIAPGTWASGFTALAFLGLARLPLALYALVVIGAFGAGVWAAGEAERAWSLEDDGRIVIDEVVGQLLALAPLIALPPGGLLTARGLGLVVTGFVAFRVLDVLKPPPIRQVERSFSGGLGVMLDDVVAGVIAAGVTAAVAALLGGAA